LRRLSSRRSERVRSSSEIKQEIRSTGALFFSSLRRELVAPAHASVQ